MHFKEPMPSQYPPLAHPPATHFQYQRYESVANESGASSTHNQAIRERNNSSEGVPMNEFDEDLDLEHFLHCSSPIMLEDNEHPSRRNRSSPAFSRSSGIPKWNSSSPFVPPPDIGIVTHTPRTNEGQRTGLNARSPEGYMYTVNSGTTGSGELVFKELGHLKDSSVAALEPPTAFDDTQGSIEREAPIETRLVEALGYLEVQPNVGEILSTTNDWGQTLAHLSILHAYPSLLSHLVDWHINLTIADVNGLTALHYAYMKCDFDSVRILRRGGASETVMDKLGRTPLELQPERFSSFMDIHDAKVAVGTD